MRCTIRDVYTVRYGVSAERTLFIFGAIRLSRVCDLMFSPMMLVMERHPRRLQRIWHHSCRWARDPTRRSCIQHHNFVAARFTLHASRCKRCPENYQPHDTARMIRRSGVFSCFFLVQRGDAMLHGPGVKYLGSEFMDGTRTIRASRNCFHAFTIFAQRSVRGLFYSASTLWVQIHKLAHKRRHTAFV